MNSLLLVLAIIYALAFWAISWRRPSFALMMIFASAPFQHDLSGGGGARFSFAEINLILALPLFLAQHKRLSLGPLAWPIAVYFAICILSSILVWRGSAAVTSFTQMFLFMIVIVFVFAFLSPEPQDVRMALYGLIAVAMFLGSILIATRQQYVLGIHKNGIGGSMSVALLVALELWFNLQNGWRKWLLTFCMVFIAAGLLFTLSRGSWLGAMGGTLLIVAMRRQWGLMLRAGLLLLPVLWVCWNALPQESREYAVGFDKKRGNIEARYDNIEIAQRYFNENPVIGVGVGVRKQYDATNLVWTTLAETGVLGVLAFAAIHIAIFRMVWKTQAKLERGDPLYSLVAVGGALILSRLLHGMVDHYWARGPTMMAWASAGMAVGAYFAVQAGHVASRHPQQLKVLLALSAIENHRRRRAGEPV